MGDIVERLRDITPKGRDVSEYHQDDLLILQAADEIERLNKELDDAVKEIVQLEEQIKDLQKLRKRLAADLSELRGNE